MSYVIFVIISLSFVFSACNGTMNDLSVAALTSCKDAVTLCISLCGTICLWSGIMNVEVNPASFRGFRDCFRNRCHFSSLI